MFLWKLVAISKSRIFRQTSTILIMGYAPMWFLLDCTVEMFLLAITEQVQWSLIPSRNTENLSIPNHLFIHVLTVYKPFPFPLILVFFFCSLSICQAQTGKPQGKLIFSSSYSWMDQENTPKRYPIYHWVPQNYSAYVIPHA